MSVKPGMSLETGASVIARDFVGKHFAQFGPAIRSDRIAGQAVVSAYIDALAGAAALVIAGGHGSTEDVINNTIEEFRKAVQRDLLHLKRT